MSAAAMLCRVRYHLADGTVVEVDPDLAEMIKKLDAAQARHERRVRKRERPFTDACAKNGTGTDRTSIESLVGGSRRPADFRTSPAAWSGPRYSFDLLLGIGLVGWSLRVETDWPCPVCGGRELAANCCCLGCDRTGRDGLIPRLTAAERAARAAKPAAADGLAGGKGKARPKMKGKGSGRSTIRSKL